MPKLSEKQKRYLSQAIQLEEAVNPAIIKATMFMVSVAVLTFIGWAAFTNVNEVARASGEVIPEGRTQVVQTYEGGIVNDIFVRDGEYVMTGQPLISLDGVGSEQDLMRARMAEINFSLQVERLNAILENRDPEWDEMVEYPLQVSIEKQLYLSMMTSQQKEKNVLYTKIEERRQNLSGLSQEYRIALDNKNIAADLLEKRKALNAQGYSSDLRLMETRTNFNAAEAQVIRIQNERASLNKQIDELNAQLSSIEARYKNDVSQQLSKISAEREQNIQLLAKLENRNSRLVLTAPTDGIISNLNINTVGEVVNTGARLMEIIPGNENMIVEVRISPQHIGHIYNGQNVQLKFSSFDFSRYGSVMGQLEHISANSVQAENGERYFKALVRPVKNHVGQDTANVIIPGMTVMADIITGEKTVLEYLLKPIQRAANTAFTER